MVIRWGCQVTGSESEVSPGGDLWIAKLGGPTSDRAERTSCRLHQRFRRRVCQGREAAQQPPETDRFLRLVQELDCQRNPPSLRGSPENRPWGFPRSRACSKACGPVSSLVSSFPSWADSPNTEELPKIKHAYPDVAHTPIRRRRETRRGARYAPQDAGS